MVAGRFQYSHNLLWSGDRFYRIGWIVAPQLLAILAAGWILSVQNTPPPPPVKTAPWASIVPIAEVETQGATLRNRALTDPNSLETLKTLADAGSGVMQFYYATIYDAGLKLSKSIAPDALIARQYYELSARQNQRWAEQNFGLMLINGSGGARDVQGGISWLTKALADGNGLAGRDLGSIYKNGQLVSKDMTVAYRWFQKGADTGDAYSQMEIGDAYWFGFPQYPYQQNREEAVQWYRKAAAQEQRYPGVDRNLGLAYRDGVGVEKDETASLKWFQLAADNGDPFSAMTIGFAYWNGQGQYPRNDAQAVKYFRIAATTQGLTGAQIALGIAYRDARGTDRDFNQARYWFQTAKSNGDKAADGFLKTLN